MIPPPPAGAAPPSPKSPLCYGVFLLLTCVMMLSRGMVLTHIMVLTCVMVLIRGTVLTRVMVSTCVMVLARVNLYYGGNPCYRGLLDF